MNKRMEILVEDYSMEVFLKGLLPRILPEDFELGRNCFIYPHEGKSDLKKRLPQRVRAYRNYPEEVLLMVVQDQDSWDCLELKKMLVTIIENENPEMNFVVRIACRELENWYLGDLKAIEHLYPKTKASTLINKSKYRNVDKVTGSFELKKLTVHFAKTSCARQIAPIIDINTNRSVSFSHFVQGMHKLAKTV